MFFFHCYHCEGPQWSGSCQSLDAEVTGLVEGLVKVPVKVLQVQQPQRLFHCCVSPSLSVFRTLSQTFSAAAYSSSTTMAYSPYHHDTETDSSGAPLLLWRPTQNKSTYTVMLPAGRTSSPPSLPFSDHLLLLLTGAPFYPGRLNLVIWLLCC